MKTKLLSKLRKRYSKKYQINPYMTGYDVKHNGITRYFNSLEEAQRFVQFLVNTQIKLYVSKKRNKTLSKQE